MALLNIVKEGDPLLRKQSRPIEEITPRILTLLDDMKDTMHAANGCGLAAVQVGVLRRVVVIEVEDGKIYEMINPRIVFRAGRQEAEEGCLSLTGIRKAKRYKEIKVQWQTREMKTRIRNFSGFTAQIIQHEMDHLEGIII